MSVNRRFADGLAFTGAYTLAKGTDAWATGILIPEFRYLNEGPSSTVSPNKLDLSASYELPFGDGKRYLTDGIAAAIVGGWQVNAYFTAFSGSTMTMTSSAASLNAPNSPQRADEVEPFKVLGGVGPQRPWFDTASFAAVTGAAVRNIQGEWIPWARICQSRRQSVSDVPLLAVRLSARFASRRSM